MKRHSFDPISLAAGIIFLLIAGTFAFSSDIDLRTEAWLLPASFLILGIGLLASTVRMAMKPAPETAQKATDDPSDDPLSY